MKLNILPFYNFPLKLFFKIKIKPEDEEYALRTLNIKWINIIFNNKKETSFFRDLNYWHRLKILRVTVSEKKLRITAFEEKFTLKDYYSIQIWISPKNARIRRWKLI